MAGPITLNRQQFLATAAGKKPGAKYANYLSYIANARGQKPAPLPQDPYAGIIAGLPSPLTPAQIQTQAAGEISPLVAAATKQIQGQTQAATNAIRGYSQDAASKLGAIDFAQPYQQAETGQAAVDNALRAALTGAGTQDAEQLAQRLAVINDPSVAAAASAVGANGAANGNTQLAQGSASLGNLIANAAAAGNYGQKQPGIARLAGLQQITGTQQQGLNQIGSQTQALEQQLPSIIQALTSQNDNRAQTLTAARENQVARQDAIGATNAKNQTTLQTAQIKAQTAQEAAAAKAAQTDFQNRLAFTRTYHYDPMTKQPQAGWEVGPNGTVVKITKPSGKPAPAYPNLTKAQVVHLRAGISSAFYGVPEQKDVNNKVVRNALPPVNYEDAITHAVMAGYSRAAAIKMANRFYMPGQRGRPRRTATR